MMKQNRPDKSINSFKNRVVNPAIVAGILFGFVFISGVLYRVANAEQSDISISSSSPIVAQLNDTSAISLEPIPVETSTVETCGRGGSVQGLSAVRADCGGAAVPVAAQLCSKNSAEVDLPTEVSRGPETVRMQHDAEIKITEVRLPLYWKGIEVPPEDYFIDVLEKGEIPDIARIIGAGAIVGGTTLEDGTIAHSAEGHVYPNAMYGPDLLNREGDGGAAMQLEMKIGIKGGGESITPDGATAPNESHKTATPLCDPDPVKPNPTGCFSGVLATKILNSPVFDSQMVPEQEPLCTRLNLEEQDCITPAAVVPGCVSCINMNAKVMGWFVRAGKTFSISPEGVVDCVVSGNCAKDVQFYLWMDNFLGDNWASTPKSANMAMDSICSSSHEPDHFGLYQPPNDLPIGANLPFCPDRYVATDCKVSVDGKEVGAWCIWPDYVHLVRDHALTTSNFCIVNPGKGFCDSDGDPSNGDDGLERYAKFVYEYHYNADDPDSVCK